MFFFFSTLSHVTLNVRTSSKFARERIKSQIKAYLTSFYLKLQSRSFAQ